MADSSAAARLRRALHGACADADLPSMRRALHALYEDNSSPLGAVTLVATPAAFSCMAETACLAQAYAALDGTSSWRRREIAAEMEANAERLHRAFGIDDGTMSRMRIAMNECEDCADLHEADDRARAALLGTQLEGRVKVARHAHSGRTTGT